MLDGTAGRDDDHVAADAKRAAMALVERAFEEAMAEGVPSDAVAHAALFAGLAELVGCFGEDCVARLAAELPERIRSGDYTLHRVIQ